MQQGTKIAGSIFTILALAWASAARADIGPMSNPADQGPASSQPAGAPSEGQHTGSWEMPPITVEGVPASPYREDDRIGSYDQPRWTASRRFPGVRTYVIPDGQVEFEYWLRLDVPRHGPTETQHMAELEFGLPGRFQLDLYAINRSEGSGGKNFFDTNVELRYAFADYGKLWGNPALYLEYAHRDEAVDKGEAKLLLTGDLGPGVHWGQNILFEWETGGAREYEYGWTGGISKTLQDGKLSVGIEAQFSLFDIHGRRGTYRDETFIGPSIQYRPRPRMHLDIAPLIGITHESPAAKLFVVFGYEF